MSKYSECDNLPPNKIKILEQSKEIKVWLGSEVSITCCMKDSLKISKPLNDFDDDFDFPNNNLDSLVWYNPKMKQVINYFDNPLKAQESGNFIIPEMIQQSKDIQIVHLIIKNFSKSDNGSYKCDTVRRSDNSQNITLIGNPKIIIDAQEYQFLEEGKSGYINCNPRGDQEFDIAWFFKGKYLSPNDHKFSFLQGHKTLQSTSVTEELAGKYLCKAEVVSYNKIDIPTKESFIEIQPIEVIVYQKPTLSDESPSFKSQFKSVDGDDVAALEDGSLEMACDSMGLPPPVITWYRGKTLLNNEMDPRINITESYYRRNAYSIIRIQPVRLQDIGLYTCNSSFSLQGFSTSVAKNITPEFLFQPRFLKLGTHLNASSTVGKDVLLNCSVFGALAKHLSVSFIHEGFNGNKNIYDENFSERSVTFVKEQDPFNVYISRFQLTVLGIQPHDAGWYYCRATIKSQKTYSFSNIGVVSVLYSPKMIKSNFTIYGLWYKKSVLKCKAKGYPNPNWEWIYQDMQLSEQPDRYQINRIDKNDTSISELTILPNYQNDAIFGTYQCIAKNQYGNASDFISFGQAWHPGAPNVTVCKVTPFTVQLCVSPNPDSGGLPLTHYEMRIKDIDINKYYGPYYYPVSPSTITFSHLQSGIFYEIALSAASEAGRGANAYAKVKTTKISKPIVDLVNTSTAPDEKSFNLQWVVDTDGGFPITNYDVEVQEVKVDPKTSKVLERVGDSKSYTIDNLSQFKQMFHVNSLTPNTWYELKFSAKNGIGSSIIQVVFRTLDKPAALARTQLLNYPFSFGIANGLNLSLHIVSLFLIFMLYFICI